MHRSEREACAVISAAEQLKRRNRELEILNAIAEALNGSLDLDGSLRTALSRVAELLDLRTGWVWLLDEETGAPYLAAEENLPPGLAEHPERMEGGCYCLDTFRQGDLTGAANVNVVTCSRLHWLREGTAGLRYHASIPIYAHGRRLGVMNVASPEWRRLSREELSILHTVGDMLGVAVERAQLYARSAEAGAVEERNRLAREIHDTLAQGLSAIALRLDTAEALIEAGAEPARVGELVGQALEVARAGLEEARRTVLDLRAAPLEGRTLAGALADLAAELDAGTDADVDNDDAAPGDSAVTRAGVGADDDAGAGAFAGAGAGAGADDDAGDDAGDNAAAHAPPAPAVRFEAVGAAHPLPPRIEAGLYRIAQEALANALAHAGARRVTVRLTAAPDGATLSVDDDGRGFGPDEVERERFGLVGMRERARLLGGSLDVETAPGAGTRIRVRVPLRESREA